MPSTSAPLQSSELPSTNEQTDTSDDKGKKRKRRSAEEKRQDEIAKQTKRNTTHGVKKECDDKCSKECTAHFDEERKKEFNELF